MAVSIQGYNLFLERIGDGSISPGTDEFRAILVYGYTFDATHYDLDDIGAVEIAEQYGYETGGKALENVTWGWDAVNSITKLDADDVSWIASGGAIGPARGAIIHHYLSGESILACYIDFGADETASDGNDFKLTFGTNGVISYGEP